MDLQLNEDQQALVSALQSILNDHAAIPQSHRLSFFRHDQDLQGKLASNGFLDAARDIGPLEAALVVYETARLVTTVDTLGRGLVAPMICTDVEFDGPIALVEESGLSKAIRNLPIASHLLVASGSDLAVLEVDPDNVTSIETILGYPYGSFVQTPELANAPRIADASANMRKWWRVGLAAEMMGTATGAIDFTIEYVKQREVFGRPVGSFQSVQHRLVRLHGYTRAGYYLAMRAAWSGTEVDAAIAASHAQGGMRNLMFDLHQFNGGMGMTTDHLLHFWVYRARALQGEVGGSTAASVEIAAQRWGDAQRGPAATRVAMVAA